MNNFNDIKQHWADRKMPLPSETAVLKIIEKSKAIRKKQLIGQVVLGLTSLVLIIFFFYISAYKNQVLFIGLGIMIGSLLLRIGIEFLSMVKKENLPTDRDMKAFNEELITFYKRRKYIHFMVTPGLFISYIVGFIMLLPSFKEEFSVGFYNYILVSSFVIFIALGLLIGVQIRKELKLLRELMES